MTLRAVVHENIRRHRIAPGELVECGIAARIAADTYEPLLRELVFALDGNRQGLDPVAAQILASAKEALGD